MTSTRRRRRRGPRMPRVVRDALILTALSKGLSIRQAAYCVGCSAGTVSNVKAWAEAQGIDLSARNFLFSAMAQGSGSVGAMRN